MQISTLKPGDLIQIDYSDVISVALVIHIRRQQNEYWLTYLETSCSIEELSQEIFQHYYSGEHDTSIQVTLLQSLGPVDV